MLSQQDIEQCQERLAAYRATLATLLKQLAQFGSAYAPPAVINGIREARAGIATCKATLRRWGVAVEDLPGDEEDDIPIPGHEAPPPKPTSRPPGVSWRSALPSLVALLLAVSLGWWLWSHPLMSPAPLNQNLSEATLAPAADAAISPVVAAEVSPAPRRIYPNPEPPLSYVWHVWRQPTGVPEGIADATPMTAASGTSWNRFWYDLAPNQFAGLALTFDTPLDISDYTTIELKIGFEQITDVCRLYIKEGEADSSAPTPTPGPSRESDPGVLLGLGVEDIEGVTRVSEGNGVQRVTIRLNSQFPRTDLTRVIEIGFEAISQPDPKPGRCDIYEVDLR